MKHIKYSIEEEIKIAERDKLLAEARRAESEGRKIEHELAESIKESAKRFWLKKEFRNSLVSSLIGLGVLGFYIVYAVLPVVNRDNLLLSIENARSQKKLADGQAQLHLDSINLRSKEIALSMGIKHTDSLKLILDKKTTENNALAFARHKVDSSYSVFKRLSVVKRRQDFKLIVNAKKSLNEYINKYNAIAEKLNNQKNDLVPAIPILTDESSGFLKYTSSLTNYKGTIDWGLINAQPNSKSISQDFNKLAVESSLKPNSIDSLFSKDYISNSLFHSVNNPSYPGLSFKTPKASIHFRPLFNGHIVNGLQITVEEYPISYRLRLNENNEYDYSLPLGSYKISINDKTYKIVEIISSEPNSILCSRDAFPTYTYNSQISLGGLSSLLTSNSAITSNSANIPNTAITSNKYSLSVNTIPSNETTVDLMLNSSN